jgi:transposase InsO family protein
VTRLGGRGIAVRCDHRDDERTRAVIERIRADRDGRLDVLVNNVWGGYEHAHRPRELVARRPNQVWCWDITCLKSAVRGEFYFLYLVADVYSREILGWSVETEESMLAAARLVEQTFGRENVGSGCLVLHADDGGPMKGSTIGRRRGA